MALKSAGDTLRLPKFPPCSRGLNPVKHRWGDLREKPLHKLIFSSDARNGPGQREANL